MSEKDPLAPLEPTPGCGSDTVPSNAKLIDQGWERRFVVEGERMRESIELYESMGFETRVEKLSRSDFGAGCGDCAQMACEAYAMLYTRKTGERE